jgi:hypothetical protein
VEAHGPLITLYNAFIIGSLRGSMLEDVYTVAVLKTHLLTEALEVIITTWLEYPFWVSVDFLSQGAKASVVK